MCQYHEKNYEKRETESGKLKPVRTSSWFKRLKPSRAQLISGAMMFSAGALAIAAAPTLFTSGTTISSSAMNANFAALDARIAALETKLASVSNITVNGHPTMRFTGVNLQVVNGLNKTASANGSGNLIVGYDEADTSGNGRCTIGTDPVSLTSVTTQAACTIAGGTWSTTGFKSGSHYVVIGSQNNYSRWGGLMAGTGNTSNYDYASITGGNMNISSGMSSNVSGGMGNIASGQYAYVSGGYINTASGSYSSVSGGQQNTASGFLASVSGGIANTASGNAASVSGGDMNTASGGYSSVSGGFGCTNATSDYWVVGVTTFGGGCSTTIHN